MELETFGEVYAPFLASGKKPHLLLGNGFSIACKPGIFTYHALFEKAQFANLESNVRSAFDTLDTKDFEIVMRALDHAAALIRLYRPSDSGLAEELERDSSELKELLVSTIADSHPDLPSSVSDSQYSACRSFLARFISVYTLSYDLLLYWTLMQKELPPPIACDDGFRKPEDDPEAAYVAWDPIGYKQDIFFLHGALHIFDAESEIQKFTWVNTGVRLKDQIRSALREGRFPVFVAEGTSKAKMAKIMSSAYLSRSFRSFGQIGGALFVFGHSLAENDSHILKRIEKSSRLSHLSIGIHGDPESETNRALIQRATTISEARSTSKTSLSLSFFNAESAHVWG